MSKTGTLTFNALYSVNGAAFQSYTLGTTITLANEGDCVSFKADGTNTTFGDGGSNYMKFTLTGLLEMSGSLGYLIDSSGGSSFSYSWWNGGGTLFNGQQALIGNADLSWLNSTTSTMSQNFMNSFLRGTNVSKVRICVAKTNSSRESQFNHFAQDCRSLVYADLSSIQTAQSSKNAFSEAFRGCYSLEELDLSNLTTANGASALSNLARSASRLKVVKLNKLSSVTGANGMDNAFNGCTSLELVDFSEAAAVPTLSDVNAFTSTNSTYKIVVPDALYLTWIGTANWSDSTIVDHIVKASEYTA